MENSNGGICAIGRDDYMFYSKKCNVTFFHGHVSKAGKITSFKNLLGKLYTPNKHALRGDTLQKKYV